MAYRRSNTVRAAVVVAVRSNTTPALCLLVGPRATLRPVSAHVATHVHVLHATNLGIAWPPGSD
jgi:hypothetical protein